MSVKQGDKSFPAPHCMKHVNMFFIDDIIHDFEQITNAIKSNEQIFVIKICHKPVILTGRKRPEDVCPRSAVLKGGFIELNFIRRHDNS
jgi:hypothetical protein